MLETIHEEVSAQKEWRRHSSDGATALVTVAAQRAGAVLLHMVSLFARGLGLPGDSSVVGTILEYVDVGASAFTRRPRTLADWGLGFNRVGEPCLEEPVVFVAFPNVYVLRTLNRAENSQRAASAGRRYLCRRFFNQERHWRARRGQAVSFGHSCRIWRGRGSAALRRCPSSICLPS